MTEWNPHYRPKFFAHNDDLRRVGSGAEITFHRILDAMYATTDCYLPSDPEELYKDIQRDRPTLLRHWPKIKFMFQMEGERMTQPKLLEAHAGAFASWESKRRGGKKSAAKRAEQRLTEEQAEAKITPMQRSDDKNVEDLEDFPKSSVIQNIPNISEKRFKNNKTIPSSVAGSVASNLNKTTTPNRSSSGNGNMIDDDLAFAEEMAKIAGLFGNPNIPDHSIVCQWRTTYGEALVRKVITDSVRTTNAPINGWRFFEKAVKESYRQKRAMEIAKAETKMLDMTDRDWLRKIKVFNQGGRWNCDYGPAPGEQGCVVPEHLLPDDKL